MSQIVKLKAVALFPGLLTNAPAECRPRLRWHKKGHRSTQVRCRIEQRDGRTVAVPEFEPPEAADRPRFRLQLHVLRTHQPPLAVALALQAARDSRVKDPEHRILVPLHNGPYRLIFEFLRADVFHVSQEGPIQIRFAAIDAVTGEVGTQDMPFDRVFLRLAQRCQAELAGGTPIFPTRATAESRTVPTLGAQLSFGVETPDSSRQEIEPPTNDPASSGVGTSGPDSVLRLLAQDNEPADAEPRKD